MGSEERKCYVITPYEQKDVGDGVVIDFEVVYEKIISKIVELIERPRLVVRRSKDEMKTGVISEEFIKSIYHADIAIIDVSGNNPNVYYELGLRHAFRKSINVLIGFRGTKLPFDIAGIQVVAYDHTTPEGQEKAARDIADHIQHALKSGHVDSPVYKFLPKLHVGMPETPCRGTRTYEYVINGTDDKRLGIKTGTITDIRGVDAWVNSENTEMEMARMCERSISSLIRYHGSIRDSGGRVKSDLIQKYLRKEVGSRKSVAPTVVIPTDSGELQRWGVRKLLHAASVQGQPGLGYHPIRQAHQCVTNSLEKMDWLNAQEGTPKPPLSSVLFPIFGTGQAGQAPEDVLEGLVLAAKEYVNSHRESAVNRIYFLAYNTEQFSLCRHVFGRIAGLEEVAAET